MGRLNRNNGDRSVRCLRAAGDSGKGVKSTRTRSSEPTIESTGRQEGCHRSHGLNTLEVNGRGGGRGALRTKQTGREACASENVGWSNFPEGIRSAIYTPKGQCG